MALFKIKKESEELAQLCMVEAGTNKKPDWTLEKLEVVLMGQKN